MLRKQGWLVKPRVRVHKTGFDKAYYGTHTYDTSSGEPCRVEECNRPLDRKRHQNNYQEIESAVAKDARRNKMIADNIVKEIRGGRCVLVLSRRLGHLNELRRLVGESRGYERLFMFTGKEDTATRMEIQKEAENGSCVLFSTLADEALDIPRIDRIHLAWPTRNTDLIRQQIGRGERPHDAKRDVVINDYLDDSGPLQGQFKDRYFGVYREEGLTVDGI